MSEFSDNLYAAMRRYLESQGVTNVHKVTGFDEEHESYGCDTCYTDEIIVYIRYVDHSGHGHTYMYDGLLGDLIKHLT